MGNKIKFYNRYTKSFEEESVYGEPFLKLLYNSKFGKLALNQVINRKLFSHIYGRLMRCARSRKKIKPFIERHKIDASIFEKKVEDFVSFDDFFTRKLKKNSPSNCR
jgi:phosphatidylserine decarboxylase